MKTSRFIFLVLSSLVSLTAVAQYTVRTEAERERANLNESGNYPVIKFESQKSRAEVQAELEKAAQPRRSAPAKQMLLRKSPRPTVHSSHDLYRGA